MFLGIPDFGIWGVYVLCILSTLLCVGYGLYNWNKGVEEESQQIMEESQWEKAEEEVKA